MIAQTMTFFVNAIGMTGYLIRVDGVNGASTCDIYFNNAGMHMTAATVNIFPGLAAGTHTVTYGANGAVTPQEDNNDRTHLALTMVEVP